MKHTGLESTLLWEVLASAGKYKHTGLESSRLWEVLTSAGKDSKGGFIFLRTDLELVEIPRLEIDGPLL